MAKKPDENLFPDSTEDTSDGNPFTSEGDALTHDEPENLIVSEQRTQIPIKKNENKRSIIKETIKRLLRPIEEGEEQKYTEVARVTLTDLANLYFLEARIQDIENKGKSYRLTNENGTFILYESNEVTQGVKFPDQLVAEAQARMDSGAVEAGWEELKIDLREKNPLNIILSLDFNKKNKKNKEKK